MKNLAILILALIFSLGNKIEAQNNDGLKIQGKSQLSVKPDIAVINFRLEGKDLKLDNAVDKLNDKINSLHKLLKKEDIEKNKISSSNYQLRKEYKHDYQRGSKEFLGYVASYNIRVEIPAKTRTINDVLEELYEEFSDIEFNMNFDVSDKLKYEDELLKLAIKNAKQKAEVISMASNISLGKIKTIVYYDNAPSVVLANNQAEVAMLRKSSVSDVKDFHPGMITLSKDILIIWNID